MSPATSSKKATECDPGKRSHFGYQVLESFDVDRDELDFLADLIISDVVPSTELQWIIDESLLAGAVLSPLLCSQSAFSTAEATNYSASKCKRSKKDVTSPFWGQDSQRLENEPPRAPLLVSRLSANRARTARASTVKVYFDDVAHDDAPSTLFTCLEPSTSISNEVAGTRSIVSPFFVCQPPVSKKTTSPTRPRPPPGTVSCVPFPSLDADSFGLIQEKVAHEPFWLLVAVTFLIRTKGTAAVPVLWVLKTKFPLPSMIADPENAEEILDMIRHLGLAKNRLSFLQKYASIFMSNPPRPGQVYRVKNYDRRDTDPSLGIEENENAVHMSGISTPAEGKESSEAWEIGHMTQGKYALDSWRIFCRDVLLGRANSWNGEGNDTLQPEWMRVKPADKELRAYLRWMWMREGFEWDPVTGDRTPLRRELYDAVNGGRVEYDDYGGLRILNQPRSVGIV